MTTENTQRKKYGSISQGLGITGLIVGIVTLLISFVPCFGMFAFIFGIIAVLISVIGLGVALKHDHPKGLIVGALVTSFLGCAIAYSQYSLINRMGSKIEKKAIEKQKEIEQKKESN